MLKTFSIYNSENIKFNGLFIYLLFIYFGAGVYKWENKAS